MGRCHAAMASGLGQPLPMNGIFVAVIVMNWTLASSGRDAMYKTAAATWRASKVGSASREPSA